MFTGLVQTQGTVTAVVSQGDTVMTIAPDTALPLALGASIACHGMCLTVTDCTEGNARLRSPQGELRAAGVSDEAANGTRSPSGQHFTVSLSAETLRCTNAGKWRVGTRINLEASLRVGDAVGGHFVSGHVDGLGTVIRAEKSGDSTVWEFEAPTALAKFIAPKGSITIDGVSLTVNQVNNTRFTVNIIPHTAAVTSFNTLAVGDTVNLEIDMLARYVARLQECA